MAKKLRKKIEESSVLENIRVIKSCVEDLGYNPKLFQVAQEPIESVRQYLDITAEETVLFCCVFVIMINNSPPELTDIAESMQLDVMSFLPHMHLFDNLIKKGYVEKRKVRRRSSEDSLKNKVYSINNELIECIIKQQPRPETRNEDDNGSLEVLQDIFILIGQCSDYDISQYELIHESSALFNDHKDLPVISEILSIGLTIQQKIIYSYVLWRSITGRTADLDTPCEAVCKNTAERMRIVNDFISGESPLIKGGWLEITEGKFNNDIEGTLTEKSLDLLKTENITVKESKGKKIITKKPEEIFKKELFFNSDEEKQWNRIHDLLLDNNFKPIQERLNEKGMLSGLTILFHGEPGTGKTESVLQLARETGREIMKIDASMTKSMWFGESEKFMKRIFTNYEELRQNSPVTPILFFNEADAILNKRKTDMSSNVAQTENALQNILLEGLENFKGIFIATTNLIQNLDNAFDRRFIYKMKFSIPSIETSTKIWQKAFPNLTNDECQKFASQFHFSGGQIDNIARKCEIEYLLNGEFPSTEIMEEFCLKEILIHTKTANRIGF
ncbi:MAG: hypothetical protein RLZ10_2655 [Bacteroidota bacterium]|jgi:SpoVK/Ycf46/Vps4 family AAA+-type ATPase